MGYIIMSTEHSHLDTNDKFKSNTQKWINITQEIIDLEKKLEVLRDNQMNLSHQCVNLTSNLSQEIKINTLISNKKKESNKKEPTEDNIKVENNNSSVKLSRKKRRTKAELDKERQDAIVNKKKENELKTNKQPSKQPTK